MISHKTKTDNFYEQIEKEIADEVKKFPSVLPVESWQLSKEVLDLMKRDHHSCQYLTMTGDNCQA